ncbi:hypothetical protein RHODO2019_04865 [Rhodococcus antarcticus]|jgi:hypothetical protein|uniref:ABM domain-containing protein n=1 Tax=Rhodococcus antarcticus TaxID=2987751 RepID=A0ABY6P2A5_9NOCA|nr:hypothetical protein [Rhodococcus antarcticus]UZJ25777.1 hypothetical protein RHODO2019_04865 [Rhodococcus antarcticus]
MTQMYAYQMDVAQPMAMWDAVHAEVLKVTGHAMPDGCLMHMATATATGFRVTEVWDSHEAADRFVSEVRRPIIERIGGADAVAAGPPPVEELTLHALLSVARSDAPV